MSTSLESTPSEKPTWFHHISKGMAVAMSTGAALVTIISIVPVLYSYGVLGHNEAHQSLGNLGAAWVELKPAVDTANAIGDTVHFAATIADKKGSILVGAAPAWTTGDSSVATVAPDGSVIARGPGVTTVTVVVGELVSHAHIVVAPQVAVVVAGDNLGDTAIVVREGGQTPLHARPLDARGHEVRGRVPVWHIDDTTVAKLDANGMLTGENAGRTVASAKVDGITGYMTIAVVTTASDLAVVAGDNQRALAGHLLPQQVVVRATDRKGAPVSGKLVTFRVRGTQGKVDPATDTTDADGRARTQWTLGDDPGSQSLLASVENIDSVTTIAAEADPVARNTRVTPISTSLRARAGEVLGDSVGVLVTDSTGRILPGVPVRWIALDGTVDAVSARTDSSGVARAKWKLSSKTGTQHLHALVGAAGSHVPAVQLDAAALSGPAARIVVVSGDRQQASAGKVLGKPIVVRVVDANGNGSADVSVVLSLSGGDVQDTSLVTDSLGYARTHWTMGNEAGDYTLAAHVDGLKKLLKVSAHATAAAAANLSFDDAPAGKSTRGTRRLVALVTDIYGNPVSEARVTFSVKSGAVSPARAVTDSHGRVMLRWMVGPGSNEQTLKGSVRGTDVTGAYVSQIVQAGSTRDVTLKHKKPAP